MPEVQTEPYSNPIAPPELDLASSAQSRANLSNEDFRKLMMTPRPAPSAGPVGPSPQQKVAHEGRKEDDDRRKKRRTLYAKLKKEEEEREAEWAKKYRDRAKERRDGSNPDYTGVEDPQPSTSGYKAVAPNMDPAVVAEHRKQEIQESKFLGGDMEHTHLVKGLDYALLQKVRSEIQVHRREVEEVHLQEKRVERERAKVEFEEDISFKTKMARNICRTLFTAKPTRNEHFSPGRMAYVFDLDDEYSESDIPTTLIRSKADCPTVESATLTTNDIVINKLTQILSYLRQGSRASGKKGRKRDKGKVFKEELPRKMPAPSESIFPDAGEYVFDPKTHASKSNAAAPTNYFNQPTKEEEESMEQIRRSTVDMISSMGQKYSGMDFSSGMEQKPSSGSAPSLQASHGQTTKSATAKKKEGKAGFGGFLAEEHYAECYPGAMEEYDATYDSDDEVDFSKMDMGNKKGPVKRWDFESEDDYNKYQSSREAMPKAAFQYGVKMSEGRKTRRFGGGMSDKAKEKAKLNREWQKISAIIDKHKGGMDGSAPKRPKLDD